MACEAGADDDKQRDAISLSAWRCIRQRKTSSGADSVTRWIARASKRLLIYHILCKYVIECPKKNKKENKANRSLLVNVTLNNASKTKCSIRSSEPLLALSLFGHGFEFPLSGGFLVLQPFFLGQSFLILLSR
jgi:hypothetical protein